MSSPLQSPFDSIKRLDATIDLSDFDCSIDDNFGLDEYIHYEALDEQANGRYDNYVFYVNSKIVGYVAINKDFFPVPVGERGNKLYLPSLVIGRLAIDNNHRTKGYGSAIIDFCVKKAVAEGCKLVIVVTKGLGRITFYEKNRFKFLDTYSFKFIEFTRLRLILDKDVLDKTSV
jgi:predicted N-acetyltransferase YhbS